MVEFINRNCVLNYCDVIVTLSLNDYVKHVRTFLRLSCNVSQVPSEQYDETYLRGWFKDCCKRIGRVF